MLVVALWFGSTNTPQELLHSPAGHWRPIVGEDEAHVPQHVSLFVTINKKKKEEKETEKEEEEEEEEKKRSKMKEEKRDKPAIALSHPVSREPLSYLLLRLLLLYRLLLFLLLL